MKVIPQSVPFSFTGESGILKAFKRAVAKIHRKQKAEFITGQFYQDLALAYAEGAANAVRHARELERKGRVQCLLKVGARHVEMRIEDHGAGYALSRVPAPKFRALAESGRGVFMMRQLMDSVHYRRGKRKNALILRRNLVGADPQARDLDLVYEISNAVLGGADAASVYKVILDRASEVFGAGRASILSYDPAKNRLKVVASRGLTKSLSKAVQVRPGEGIAGYVFQHSKPCLIEDIEKNPSGWKKKSKYKSRSFISAPLVTAPMRQGQRTIGVINMTDRLDGRRFTKKDLKLLTTIANQASAYLHMGELWAQAKDAQLLRREMEIAREIQQSYLPKLPPEVDGLDLAGWCETAQSVGGDYYDLILKDRDTFYAVIADVSGHNIGAAMTMVTMRSQLKNCLLTVSDPGELLTLLNAQLHEDLARNDQFVSMFLMRYRVSDGRADYANAGHRIPFLLRADGAHPLSPASDSGSVLGAIEGEKYATRSFLLGPGEGIFLYTDGIPETMGPYGKRLGMDRLTALLQSARTEPAGEVLRRVREEVSRFRGKLPAADDATAACVRRV